MNLECKHVWEYISGYLDDALDAATRADVERHLAHCEICSAILDSTRNILVLTADDRVFELPIGFSDRLHARLEEVLEAAPEQSPQSGDKPSNARARTEADTSS